MNAARLILVCAAALLALASGFGAEAPKKGPAPKSAVPTIAELATAPDPALPPLQMFVPGFVVRELPVQLTNQNNTEYAPDGRLFTSGYDGRVHLLRDTDRDGLEDQVTTLWDKTSGDYSLGMAFRDGSLYVIFRNEIARFRDTDGDGVPETREVALTNWDDPVIDKAKLILHRRVDYGIGLAPGPDGSFFLGMGNAAFRNPYRRDTDGVVHYRTTDRRGTILHVSADGSRIEQVASGVRYTMSLQFNRHGDLFAADQEGATWMPNGNPFDELLHIEAGRHYGFPPRHPQFLPGVIDEPSVFDYGPQHQGICGFRFNESGPDRGRFGPAGWEGDAILMGQSRGKIFRTKLVRTPAGYVAQNHLLAALQALPVDCAISPRGELIVAAHTGKPDWGTGPQGMGRLFKVAYVGSAPPHPVLTYAASPTETRVEFDRPLNPATAPAALRRASLQSGRGAIAGARYEKIKPGYAVVQAQKTERLRDLPVKETGLSGGGRTVTITTAPRVEAVRHALSLPGLVQPKPAPQRGAALEQDATVELGFELGGVEAEWTPRAAGASRWEGWLPHPDLRVARELTAGSAAHERLFNALGQPGTLRLRGQFDLNLMLHPEIQPGSTLNYVYPPEKITLLVAASGPAQLKSGGAAARVEPDGARAARLTAETKPGSEWIPFELTVETGAGAGGEMPRLDLSWSTAEDPRPRALPLRRVLLPWARLPAAIPATREIPEIAGGNWERGRQLFHGRANCFACHAVRGTGATFGPDLTNSIHRDYASLLRDINEPSATINPDHLGYVVELTDGSSLAGIVAGDTPEALQLADMTGKVNTVPKSRLRTMKPMAVSLMPGGLADSLSPPELRDLMTFLLTLPPGGPLDR